MKAAEGASKTLAAVLAVFLLAAGLTACGGSDGSSTTSSAEAGPIAQEGDSAESGSKKSEAAEFTPKPHHDSGGGAVQFRREGGDNSVQEFGSEASESELRAAAAALHNFLDARAAGNWAAACGYMSKSIVKAFKRLASSAKQARGVSCATILEAQTNPAAMGQLRAEAARADVGSLRVEGDRGFVIYRGPGKTILAMRMAYEGRQWKVVGFAGTPLK